MTKKEEWQIVKAVDYLSRTEIKDQKIYRAMEILLDLLNPPVMPS